MKLLSSSRIVGGLLAAAFCASSLFAAEHRGAVLANGLPLPGASITATQGDKKFATTTGDRGEFAFANLSEGAWRIDVEMLGFAPATREVNVAAETAATSFEMKFLSREALVSALNPAPGITPASAPAVRSSLSPTSENTPEPRAHRAAPTAQRGDRPGFQRLSVNQTSNPAATGSEGALRTEEMADLNQSAANSFTVQGSMSSAAGLPQQNDWGRGPIGGMFGGPGMMGDQNSGMPGQPGMGGPNGDGPGSPQMTSRLSGGPGGPGGGRGPGGPGGGFGGPGGGPPGGGFGGRGGPRGPGGFGGPRGGPDWRNRPDARSFGNGRRDPRGMYMGMASFSLDNSAVDAQTYSVTGANLAKPAYAFARGNVMLGGPLRIPKLVSAQKRIMFTIDLQFQRNRTGVTSDPVNMPTALERMGDFSQTAIGGKPVTIYDPTTGLPFANNVIPASRLNATALALLQYFPSPNLPFASRNYETSLNGLSSAHNINSRLSNIKLDTKDRLNFSFGYQGGNTITPNLLQFSDTGASRAWNASLGWSRNFNTHWINNAQFMFSRNRQGTTPYFADGQNIAAQLGIAGTSQSPLNYGPPSLRFTNYGSLADGTYSLNRNQTGSAGDSLIWIHGSHNSTFGGDYRRMQFNQLADSNGRGAYTFNGFATSLMVNGVSQTGTGYDLADFLLGTPTTSSIRYGNADKYFRGSGYDVYVNDDWRVTPNFTLNIGLRWDYASPFAELYNRLVNLDIASGYTAVAAVEPGQTALYSGLLTNALIQPDRNNFSPRAGIAWRPFTDRSTIVRAGYGVYYNTSVYNMIASNMAQQPPFAQSLSVSNSIANPLNINNAFLSATNFANLSTYAIDPNYRIGYAQTWNVTLQNDLPFSLFGTVGYLGTKGTRLDQQFIPNSVAPGAPVSALPHSYVYETSNGNSTYHAAQFQLNRRFHAGLMAHASYQFSKSIDDGGTGGRGQGNTPVAQNWQDLSAERALSSFDSRHNLQVQFQYSTGMGTSGGTLVRGWKGALMKDWTLSGGVNAHSGNPFTVAAGGSNSQVSGTAVSNTLRANATGLPVSAAGMLFNTGAFAQPLAGQWGNAGRNTIPGPNVFSLNAAIGRVFRIGERRNIDLQVQAQNALNHVTITNWGTLLGSDNYGLATSAAAMRKITANLRFRF